MDTGRLLVARARVWWQQQNVRQRVMVVMLSVAAVWLMVARTSRAPAVPDEVMLQYTAEWCGRQGGGGNVPSGQGFRGSFPGGQFDSDALVELGSSGISPEHQQQLRALDPGRGWTRGSTFFKFLVDQTVTYRDMWCKDSNRELNAAGRKSFATHVAFERSFIFNNMLNELPSYDVVEKELFPRDRGLVFTVANKKLQLDSVERTMDILMSHGDRLPAELWTFDGEIPDHKVCYRQDVTCRDMRQSASQSMFSLGLSELLLPASAYEFCIYAIFFSGFKEIVNLDYDAAPLGAVSRLFQSEIYRKSGQLFYSDWWGTSTIGAGQAAHASSPLWNFVKVLPYPSREQESGVLFINKRKHWRELNVALHLSRHQILMPKISPTGYLNVIWGDKDLWRVAFMMLRKPFFVGTGVMLGHSTLGWFCNGGSFGHIDPEDPSKVLFVHMPKTLDLPFLPNLELALVDINCPGSQYEPFRKFMPMNNCRSCWMDKAGSYNYRNGKMENVASEWVKHECIKNCENEGWANYVHNASFV